MKKPTIKQSLNSLSYDVKNYADLGGFSLLRPLLYLHNFFIILLKSTQYSPRPISARGIAQLL